MAIVQPGVLDPSGFGDVLRNREVDHRSGGGDQREVPEPDVLLAEIVAEFDIPPIDRMNHRHAVIGIDEVFRMLDITGMNRLRTAAFEGEVAGGIDHLLLLQRPGRRTEFTELLEVSAAEHLRPLLLVCFPALLIVGTGPGTGQIRQQRGQFAQLGDGAAGNAAAVDPRFRIESDRLKVAVPGEAVHTEYEEIPAAAQFDPPLLRCDAVHGDENVERDDRDLLLLRRIDLERDEIRENGGRLDRNVAGEENPLRRDADRDQLRHHPVRAFEPAQQRLAAGQRRTIARCKVLPGTGLRGADNRRALPFEVPMNRRVEAFERRLLNRDRRRVFHPLRQRRGEPVRIGDDGLGGTIRHAHLQLGEKTGPLRQLMKVAAAEVSDHRLDLIGPVPEHSGEVVKIVPGVSGIAAPRTVAEPLPVDLEPVAAVGADREMRFRRNSLQPEIPPENRTEIVAASVPVVGPDPVGGNIHRKNSPKWCGRFLLHDLLKIHRGIVVFKGRGKIFPRKSAAVSEPERTGCPDRYSNFMLRP